MQAPPDLSAVACALRAGGEESRAEHSERDIQVWWPTGLPSQEAAPLGQHRVLNLQS